MADRFEFFEHTADIGVHIYGATLPDLFHNAAMALYAAMGELQKSEITSQKHIALRTASPEDLLHDWLAELLYEVEANHVRYDGFEFTRLDGRHLEADLRGAEIDFARSRPHEEIKAVTYHRLCAERLPGGRWRATVIFDV